MAEKPNQIVPKVPLQPLPALQEPSSRRIIVDCWEPLPKKRSGHQYLMTIMCASSRFPEAVPLRNISAKVIVRALTKLFTPVGLPSSIQSDQGSNVVWHISTRHARAWSHTVYVNRMSPSKSKSSRKMAPNTEEHDQNLLFRNRERLGRGYPSTTVSCRWVSTGVSRIHSSLYLSTLPEDLLNCLKRSYYLAALTLWISYSMIQIFAVSVLELVS